MQAEINPRNFNPMSVPGLSSEALKAVNAAFDAMSTWRTETVQFAEQWQKACADAMALWGRAGKLYDNPRVGRHSS
jgi:hypothetical protein